MVRPPPPLPKPNKNGPFTLPNQQFEAESAIEGDFFAPYSPDVRAKLPTVFHLLSMVFIFAGFILLSAAWRVLYRAQRSHELAVTGPYAYIRHPQYAAFILIMIGFLLQWPTLVTLVMFPILEVVYVKLAHREEREVRAEFGRVYEQYAALTPGFIPRLNSLVHRTAH